MLHVIWTQGNWVESWLLVVGSQTTNLTPGLSFGHNLCLRYPNGRYKPILNIYTSIAFSNDINNSSRRGVLTLAIVLWRFGSPLGTPPPKWECEGSCPHTLCTPGNMWSDSQVSFLARNLATPCHGREPKVRVATCIMTFGKQITLIKTVNQRTMNISCPMVLVNVNIPYG
jgi:hypothetical protein